MWFRCARSMEPLSGSSLRASQQFPRKERCPMCQAGYQYECGFITPPEPSLANMYSESRYNLKPYVTLEFVGLKYDQNFGSAVLYTPGISAGYETRSCCITSDKSICPKETQFTTSLLLLKTVPQLICTPYVDGFGSFWWCIARQDFNLYTPTRCKFLDLFESTLA